MRSTFVFSLSEFVCHFISLKFIANVKSFVWNHPLEARLSLQSASIGNQFGHTASASCANTTDLCIFFIRILFIIFTLVAKFTSTKHLHALFTCKSGITSMGEYLRHLTLLHSSWSSAICHTGWYPHTRLATAIVGSECMAER